MTMADLFRIDPAPTFAAAVVLTAPGGVPRELRLVFRHKGRAAARAWIDEVAKRSAEEEADILMEIIANWEGVEEPFDRAALARLIDNHFHAAEEIYLGYLEALAGARRGN